MGRLLGTQFASLVAFFERHLEAMAVVCYSSMHFPILPVVLPLLLLFTSLWWIPVVYGIWLLYDWKTPKRGGYAPCITNYWKKLKFFHYVASYFPIRLNKTADLSTGANYLICCHPHGVFAFGACINWLSDTNGISTKFPGLNIRLAATGSQFLGLLRREWFLLEGMIHCCRQSLEHLLDTDTSANNAVVLNIGGLSEIVDAYPGCHTLTLKNRKGFIRVALDTGAQLVPVYSFGENDVYGQVDSSSGSRLWSVQDYVRKTFGAPLFLVNVKQAYNHCFGLLPHRKPINTVVGAPIAVEKTQNATAEQVDKLHKKYVDALTELFEANKTKFGVPPDQHLIFV